MNDAVHGAHPYAGLRVLELSEDIGGEFLGRLLAEMGAEVIKVEHPRGAPTRAIGPFANGQEGPENSLTFWYYNNNKRGVTIDYEASLEPLSALLADRDIFITTMQPARLAELGLDLYAVAEAHPALIVVSITAYGLTGPWKDYKPSNLVALAGGGPLFMCGYDDHSIPPINPGGDQAYHTATTQAHIGLLAALIHRQATGLGQVLDISMHSANAVNMELGNPYWFYPKANVLRQTCRHAQPVMTNSPLFQCGDGRYVYYTLILGDEKAWIILVEWMEEKGLAAQLTDPEYSELAFRQTHFDEIQTLVECFFLLMDANEAYLEGQRRGLPIGIVNAPEDLFNDEHLRARSFFVEIDMGPEHGPVVFPGEGYRFTAFGSVPRHRAPRLGEHNAEVLGKAE
ncbi:CaiB/BaiF CoA transferase family protein [Sphingomonas tabacisoli]|uniref:CaiB/BaiF CoA transferase family protein n=1 Tax=Sphingomonas tabacisoli TaxID=2249466 RepID=A0ABW4I1I4_9SPHN